MGEEFSINIITGELTSSDLVRFKYAPTASVDVERIFSRYKSVLVVTNVHSSSRACLCSQLSTATQAEISFNVL
jgi:hypothetical protein